MRSTPETTRPGALQSLRASLMMLCFGLGILAFLVAIERPQWFHLRPATGTARAMSAAAAPAEHTPIPGSSAPKS